ncbi:MAG TPA: filamentous hemagglutinin N-terminal domain-containing protein, partial [Aliidongia sp.]|uniref:beta strand repeat-containing protein n=1 Tax=Aliidongia sp. TaxID=1914230 RepID=UPI002DDCC590
MGRAYSSGGQRRAIGTPRATFALTVRQPMTRGHLLGSVCAFALAATAGTAYANPTGGTVVGGQATITQQSSSQLTIQQTTNNAAINWQSFNIAKGEKTTIEQPGSSSILLNRVTGGDPSVIAGQLTANGQVVLVNPSGLVFTKGALIDVNSLIATPADISNADLMAGRLNFSKASPNATASVRNAGTISVADHGLAALVAPNVQNSGMIVGRFGKVILGGAETFTLDLYGDGLMSFDITGKVRAAMGPDGKKMALVTNTGTIVAEGGQVLLSADAIDGLVSDLIQADGTIAARSTRGRTGSIAIDAGATGKALVGGVLDVSGLGEDAVGGKVAVTGGQVALAATAQVDATGRAGGGTIEIGGGAHGADAAVRNAAITTVAAGATLDASATDRGNGGTVAVWSERTTVVGGTIKARGGKRNGDGGFVETSSKGRLAVVAGAQVDTSAPHGKVGQWLLDPSDITVDTGGTATLTDVEDGTDTTGVLVVLPSVLNAAASDITLKAVNTVTINQALNITTAGVSLNVDAGGAVAVNAAVTTNGGNFTVRNFAGTGTSGAFSNSAAITTGSGTIDIKASSLSLGADLIGTGITLTGPTAITATTKLDGGAGGITTGSITGAGQTLKLAGSGTDSLASGSTVSVGTLDLSAITGGTVTVTGLTATTLTAGTGTYGLTLVGGTIGTATTLANGGTATIDGVTFTGGLDTTDVGGTVTVSGTVAATNNALTFGTIALGGSTTLSAGTGLITVGGGGGNASLTLQGTGGASVGSLNLGAGTLTTTGVTSGAVTISGTLIATGFNLGAVTLDGATTINAASGNLTLGAVTGGSNALTLEGTGSDSVVSVAGVTTLTLAKTGGGITFSGAVDPTSGLTVSAGAYNIALDGGGTAPGATVFANTGSLTIGSGYAFTGGVTATAPSSKSVSGTISTTDAALDFGTTGVTLAGNTDFSAGTGAITLGAVSGGHDLTLTGSGGATLASAALSGDTVDVSALTGTLTSSGSFSAGTLTGANGLTNLAFDGGGTIGNAQAFTNSGTVAIDG